MKHSTEHTESVKGTAQSTRLYGSAQVEPSQKPGRMARLTAGRSHNMQLLQDAQRPEVDSKGWHREKQGLLGHRAWRMQHLLSSFLLCSKRGRFINIFRNSLEMYQALFKSTSLAPWSCCAPYQNDLFSFLKSSCSNQV